MSFLGGLVLGVVIGVFALAAVSAILHRNKPKSLRQVMEEDARE